MIFFVPNFENFGMLFILLTMGNSFVQESPRVPFKFKETSYVAVVVIKNKRPTQIRYQVLNSILELQSRPNYANQAKEIFVEIS